MQKIVLQNIKMPVAADNARNALYCNHSNNCLDLLSYFNAFAANKWFELTKIKNLHLYVQIEGTADISLVGLYENEESTISSRQMVDTLDIEIAEKKHNLLGIRFQNTSSNFKFISGYFYTITDGNINDVNLGIAICTYKREQYLLSNLELLQNNILENSSSALRKYLQIYVADNGNTIRQILSTQNRVSHSNITIFENINAGGTAGFTRCIIEFLKNKNQPTHILLMDDDATFDAESIERTFALLRTLKDEYKNNVIGGAMLKEELPCFQQECGAFWNKSFLSEPVLLGQNINLSTNLGLLQSITKTQANYNAWFFCCMPITAFKKDHLPIPFFLHFDDIEYGIRTGQNVILLNGICVWHPTEGKYSPCMRFYDSRNSIIASISLGSKVSVKDILYKNVRSFIDCITLYKYIDWNMYYKAVKSILNEGSSCLERDPQELHGSIIKNKYETISLADIVCKKEVLSDDQKAQQVQYTRIVNGKRILDAIISFITLFLPAFRKDVCQMNSSPNLYAPSFRFRKNIYVYSSNQQCFLLRKSLGKSLKATFQFFHLNILTIIKLNRAKRDITNNFMRLTSLEFWNKYLQLDK